MSTCNISTSLIAKSPSEFIPRLEHGATPQAKGWRSHGAVERWLSGVSASFRECRRRMRVMRVAFAQSESADGTRSRERSEERLRDEEAWVANG